MRIHLEQAIPGFHLKLLRKELKPFQLHWAARLRSTNDHAADLRRRGELFAPAVILAGRQTAGRGRGANNWWSAPGSITVTFALPIDEHLSAPQIPLAVGLAVRNAVAELSGSEAIRLKWPNDLLHDGLKLCGLLCERVERVDLIGIGLNLNVDPASAPRELRRQITSVRAIAGRVIEPNEALLSITSHLRRMLDRRREQPFSAILREYERHHDLAGRQITVLGGGDEAPIRGECRGLDAGGRLLVHDGRQMHRVVAGHIQVSR